MFKINAFNNTVQRLNTLIKAYPFPSELKVKSQVVPIIEAIATGVPENALKQADAAKFVANLPSSYYTVLKPRN